MPKNVSQTKEEHVTGSSARKVYRKSWIAAIMWVAAAIWAANTVLNLVWFGELSVLNVALPILWAFLAILYGRPYAVIDGQDISIAVAPLRPKKIRRDQIVSFEEAKPGIVKLGFADGASLVVRLKDVRKPDQGYLRSELGSHLSATASEPTVAPAG